MSGKFLAVVLFCAPQFLVAMDPGWTPALFNHTQDRVPKRHIEIEMQIFPDKNLREQSFAAKRKEEEPLRNIMEPEPKEEETVATENKPLQKVQKFKQRLEEYCKNVARMNYSDVPE